MGLQSTVERFPVVAPFINCLFVSLVETETQNGARTCPRPQSNLASPNSRAGLCSHPWANVGPGQAQSYTYTHTPSKALQSVRAEWPDIPPRRGLAQHTDSTYILSSVPIQVCAHMPSHWISEVPAWLLGIHSFTHSFIKHISRAHCVPCSVLGLEMQQETR